MPAPTAAIQNKKEDAVEINEDEGKTSQQNKLMKVMINPTEPAIPVTEITTEEMHIDEESRPHFPPSTQTVHIISI